ncbi:hypothetical protein SY88_11425 [Clostridiales bacterium PH28_bin88]|nr:hypothetical protein SY88_11425 [Clostridiales bacterium PH28_bin88]
MRQINLLPPELRREPGVEARRAFQRVLLLSLALVLVAGSSGLLYRVYSLQRELALVQAELMRFQPIVEQVQKAKEDIAQKEQELAHMQSVYNQRRLWGVILDGINDRSPRDVWLTKLSADENGSFSITGIANSLTSVGIFQNQLNLMSELEGISLISAEENTLQGIRVVKFEMKGRIRQGGGG